MAQIRLVVQMAWALLIRRRPFFVLDLSDRYLHMTKSERYLTKDQGRTSGQVYIAAVGVVFALLLFLPVQFIAVRQVLAQAQNGISEPESGELIGGVVTIRGTATHQSFLRYEVAFSRGGDWLVFAEGDQPVVDGTLAIWDTTVGQPGNAVFPDGLYQLRLRVVRQDYNYDEYFVQDLMVSNATTATPTGTATTEGQATSQPGTPAPQATGTSGLIIIRPTPLPSLTPFPTPSLSAPPVNDQNSGRPESGAALEPGVGTVGSDEGLLYRLLNVETDRFGRAFWAGVRIALYVFALVACYLLIRWLVRIVWRRILVQWYRRE